MTVPSIGARISVRSRSISRLIELRLALQDGGLRAFDLRFGNIDFGLGHFQVAGCGIERRDCGVKALGGRAAGARCVRSAMRNDRFGFGGAAC